MESIAFHFSGVYFSLAAATLTSAPSATIGQRCPRGEVSAAPIGDKPGIVVVEVPTKAQWREIRNTDVQLDAYAIPFSHQL